MNNSILTEEDFKLIIDALEYYPNKNDAAKIGMDIMGLMLGDARPESKGKIEELERKREMKYKEEKERSIEKIRILQGKMYAIKNELITNGAVNTANSILGNENKL